MNDADRKMLEKGMHDVVNAINGLQGEVEGLVFELVNATWGEEAAVDPQPIETVEQKLARLDPETMSKHPELWQKGDSIEDVRLPGSVSSIRDIVKRAQDSTHVVLDSDGKTHPDYQCDWLARPPLPKWTIVEDKALGTLCFAAPTEDGRYDMYEHRDGNRAGGCFWRTNRLRSDFRVIALPEKE